jgi:hypothetical protein
MRCVTRVLALSLLVLAALSASERRARADDEDPRELPRRVDTEPAPGFTFLFDFGPTFGWYAGGHIGAGLAFRLSDSLSFVVAPRVAGGQGWDANPFVAMGGDLGLRIRRVADVSGVGHFGLGTMCLLEIEGPRTNYVYVAPYVRLGGGVRLGVPGKRRFGWGVEGSVRAGYAVDVTDHSIELSDVDYSGVYGAFEVSIVLEF